MLTAAHKLCNHITYMCVDVSLHAGVSTANDSSNKLIVKSLSDIYCAPRRLLNTRALFSVEP